MAKTHVAYVCLSCGAEAAKGRSVLLECARLAEAQHLNMQFVLFGTLSPAEGNLPANLLVKGKYREDVAEHTDERLRLMGHSKGGNLAVYAAIHANCGISRRIDIIYSNSSASSDRFLCSASNLTLQNINLGYTLPTKWVRSVGLSNVRIYAAGSNLYYWSARRGFDPRSSFTGDTDNTYSYSPSATISGGVKVTF